MNREVSIIIPTFNEKDNIKPLFEKLCAALEGVSWEAVFVDDDSKDGTANVVREIAAKDNRVRCLHRIDRKGLSSACIEGMQSCSSQYMAVMDADMQHDETILTGMLRVLENENIDIVVGSRYVAGGGLGKWSKHREIISRVATKIGQAVIRADLKDPMSGFFMLKRKFFENTVNRLSGRGFKILLDLFASSPQKVKFKELPYEFKERQAGESKLDFWVTFEYGIMIFDKIFRKNSMNKNPKKLKNIKKVLIVRTDHIGEVLLSTVVVDAIKKHYPQAKITFATSSLSKSIVEAKQGIDEIIVFETLGKKITFFEMFIWAGKLLFKRFDLAIVLNSHKFLHLAIFFAGIKWRLGFERKWSFLLTHKIADHRTEGTKHEVDYTLELLEAIGIKEQGLKPELTVSESEVAQIRNLLISKSIDLKKKLIVVQPGSSIIQKRWPNEYFIELIQKIISCYDVNILLLGNNDEAELCSDISKQFDENIFNLAGKLNLMQLIALLSIAGLVITNDSGPMHIAASLNKIFVNLDHVTKNYRDPSSNVYFQALRGIDLKVKKGYIIYPGKEEDSITYYLAGNDNKNAIYFYPGVQ